MKIFKVGDDVFDNYRQEHGTVVLVDNDLRCPYPVGVQFKYSLRWYTKDGKIDKDGLIYLEHVYDLFTAKSLHEDFVRQFSEPFTGQDELLFNEFKRFLAKEEVKKCWCTMEKLMQSGCDCGAWVDERDKVLAINKKSEYILDKSKDNKKESKND